LRRGENWPAGMQLLGSPGDVEGDWNLPGGKS
jgi:hypothetical protein